MTGSRTMRAMPAPEGDSHAAAATPRPKSATFDEAALLARSLWNVREAAFMCRVGVRTVWRLMADPTSRFPAPRRIGRRTLLKRDEVLAFLHEAT